MCRGGEGRGEEGRGGEGEEWREGRGGEGRGEGGLGCTLRMLYTYVCMQLHRVV